MDLITRRVIREIEGENPDVDLTPYADPDTPEYKEMLRRIGEKLNFTTLRYHRLDDMIESVGIERENSISRAIVKENGRGECDKKTLEDHS